jgi:hypothetical protein
METNQNNIIKKILFRLKIAKVFLYKKIKKLAIFVLAYSFVIITLAQLICNVIFIFNENYYKKNSFYLSQVSGFTYTTFFIILCLPFAFKFCKVSRICAVSQIILLILWNIIQEDNTYNITSQIIIGTLALLFTLKKILK